MRRLLIIFSLLSLLGGRAHAQHLYASVRQNGAELESLGTADFSVDADSPATVEFVDGKAVMTIGGHRVAALPMSDGGELVLAFETTLANDAINRVVKSPSERLPYSTVYSPFQLVVPSGCEVYAPTFDGSSMTLHAGDAQRLKVGDIVAPETPLLGDAHGRRCILGIAVVVGAQHGIGLLLESTVARALQARRLATDTYGRRLHFAPSDCAHGLIGSTIDRTLDGAVDLALDSVFYFLLETLAQLLQEALGVGVVMPCKQEEGTTQDEYLISHTIGCY